VLCASPDYVKRNGQPAEPAELKFHNCITHAFGSGAEYRLRHQDQTTKVAVTGSFFCDETALLCQAVLAGAGIGLLPTYYVVDDLQQGRLVRLLPEHEPEPLGIHAVYLSRKHQPQALRLLIELLVERFGGDPAPWDVAATRRPRAVSRP
jgi:DNA-binding transcriptional LysR family regulator